MSEFLEAVAVYGLCAMILGLSLFYGLWFGVLNIAPNSIVRQFFPREENASSIFLTACVAGVGLLGILVGISLCNDTLRKRTIRIEKLKTQERRRTGQTYENDSEADEIIIGHDATIKQKKVQ